MPSLGDSIERRVEFIDGLEALAGRVAGTVALDLGCGRDGGRRRRDDRVGGSAMAKTERWQINVDYIETCNCEYGCPCNFSGYPTSGFCEALVAYHIRDGRYGRTRLDDLDVVYAAAWPRAIHQGGGRLRLYISEGANPAQRDALVRIFSGQAKGTGAFELFASTMAVVEDPVFTPIEMRVDGRRSAFRIPNVCEVALAPHTNPVSGEVQDVRLNLPKGFIFRSAQAAKTLVMKLFGAGPLSFDHSGQNAFFARLEFHGP